MKKKLIAALTAMMMLGAAVLPGEALTAQAAPLVRERAAMYGATNNSTAEKDSNADYVTDNGFAYSLNGTTATITGYSGTATSLTVPLKIEVAGGGTSSTTTGSTSGTTSSTSTYDVTAIASYAFAGNAGLTDRKSVV